MVICDSINSLRRTVLITCFLLLFFGTSSSQERTRVVDNERYKKSNEPLKVEYKLGNKPFLSGNNIKAGPDWLTDLKLQVRNISKKTIVYFHLQLVVEKQGTMPNKNAVTASFPGAPEPVFDGSGKPTGELRRPVLRSGELVIVSLPKNQVEFLLNDLRARGVYDLELISLDIRYVHFDDGTRWMLGREYRQDSVDPSKWVPVGVSSEK